MPGWLTMQFAAGFLCGALFGVLVYVADWLWQVKVLPKRRNREQQEQYPPVKTVNAALKEKERRERDDRADPPTTGQIEPQAAVRPPPSPPTPRVRGTGDLPVTQEHAAPSTSMIDYRQPPPPLPPPAMPYRGPERRLRSDNPYPELRRRAEDRERYEDSFAGQAPKPPSSTGATRMTRAEERRLREGTATEREQTDTERE